MSGSPVRKVIAFGALIAIIAMLVPFSVSCSKPPKPTAAFTVSYVSGEILIADPIAGVAPITVRFTDQSSGKITSGRWNLGDGTVVQGSGGEARDFTHTYETANSNGYVVVLTVRGPGGEHTHEKSGVVTIMTCSEGAASELNQARQAIKDCLNAAGSTALDSEVLGWDGSRGVVVPRGVDAADYLGVWETFKATYDVAQDGTITSGTDVSWGCVFWDPNRMAGKPGWRANT
jgi:PKD repeat protein